jgi:hypothetical protein
MRAIMSGPREFPPTSSSEGADIDARYGLEPVLDVARPGAAGEGPAANESATQFVTVACPYCGEPFETRIDTSAGAANYIEDCQVCCQPIEMILEVDADGAFANLSARRGD